jgi:GT2 family glycosyltransferase
MKESRSDANRRNAMTVTICIPTYCRPGLLAEALDSCVSQSRAPEAILIGDDSPDPKIEPLIAQYQRDTRIKIRYVWNSPTLGQARNINHLYQQTETSHLLLLHDDDVLLPDALRSLTACWDRHPELTAAYGKQFEMSNDGKTDQEASEKLNRDYFRTGDRAGVQSPAWFPGIAQQFPNDGFLMRADVARAISWRTSVGNGGEYDFGLRLSLNFSGFYFLNEYTMSYRRSSTSMSRSKSDDAALWSYRLLAEASLPPEAEELRALKLREFAPPALLQAIRHSGRREALRIYWSRHFGWRRRLLPAGVWRLAQSLSTNLWEQGRTRSDSATGNRAA